MLDAGAVKVLDASHCDRVVRDDAIVITPDNQVLLIYASGAIPPSLRRAAFDAAKYLRPSSNNRTQTAGGRRIAVPSAVLGFFDPCPRFPYCRTTTFTDEHRAEFAALHALFVTMSEKYR